MPTTELAPAPCYVPEARDEYLCRCLAVTEAEVVETVVQLGLRTLEEVKRCTGAGDGCTACHRRIRTCLERHS
jgi:bacterioferritin-associated ferredoxin